MSKITKFPIFEEFGQPLNVKIFQKSFAQVIFHEMTQLAGVRLKTFKVDKIWTTLMVSCYALISHFTADQRYVFG